MKKALNYVVGLVIVAAGIGYFLFQPSSNLPSYIKYIPQEATKVVSFDSKNVFKKVALESIFDLSFYQLIKDILKKEGISNKDEGPEELGFSLFSSYYFYTVEKTDTTQNFHGSIIPLDNAKKFSDFMVEKYSRRLIELENFRFVQTTENSIVAWNDEIMMLVGGHKDPARVLIKLADLNNSNNLIGQNESFQDFHQEDFEVGTWFNVEVLYRQNSTKAAILGQLGVTPEKLRGSYLTSYLYFIDGAVDMELNFHFNEDMGKTLPGLFVSNNNQDLMKHMILDQIPLIGRFSLDMGIGNKIIASNQGDYGLIGNMIISQGVPKMLSGDFSVSLNHVSMKEVKKYSFLTETYDTILEPNYEFLAGVTLKEKQQFMELINNNMFVNFKDGYYDVGGGEIYMFIKEDKLYFTTSARVKDEFLGSSINEIDAAMKAEKMQMRVNVEDMINKFSSGAIDYLGIQHTDIINEHLKTIDLQVNGLKDDTYKAKVKLNMKDQSQNSLYIILGMYNETIEVPRF